MTKAELQERLATGEKLEDLFTLSPGQEGLIYKAESFSPGNEIIYIPDLSVHDLSFFHPAGDQEEIEDILALCSTGDDFLIECGGDEQKAKTLFQYCDWQSPSAAIDEITESEDALDHGPPLDKDAFWKLIDDAKGRFPQDKDGAVLWMVERLTEMGVQSAVDFYEIQSAYMSLADKYGLWTAALIPMKYCSDDGFIDFRAWLIAQGKEVYMKALENPDSLAELEISDDCAFESFNYVGDAAYEKLTGKEIYDRPAGEWTDRTSELEKDIVYWAGIDYPFEWNEVEAYLPRLCAKHLTPETLAYNKAHLTNWGQSKPEIIAARLAGATFVKNMGRTEIGPSSPQREELRRRLEDNYQGYMVSLARCNTLELVERAREIANIKDAYDYLRNFSYSEKELAYLLRFQNPLEIVADKWPGYEPNAERMDDIVEEMADTQSEISVYPLAKDAQSASGFDSLEDKIEALLAKAGASIERHNVQWNKLSSLELIASSREITALKEAYLYLVDAPALKPEEIDLLIQDDDPCKTIADKLLEGMADIGSKDVAVEKALNELKERRDKGQEERPSALQRLREKNAESQESGGQDRARPQEKEIR